MAYMKQLQYFKRALFSWSRSRYHQTVKGIYGLITGKQYQKTVTRGSRCLQCVKIVLFQLQKLSRCTNWNKLL